MWQMRKDEGGAHRGGTERRDAAVEQLARAQPLPILARHQPDPREAERDEAEAEEVGGCRRRRRDAMKRVDRQDGVAGCRADQGQAEHERGI